MPDKVKYVEEMSRVLKPGGRIVIATWCQREEGDKPFNAQARQTPPKTPRLLMPTLAFCHCRDIDRECLDAAEPEVEPASTGTQDPRLLVRRMDPPVFHLD